ncbi:MAG TPA: hypothetical protein VFP61_01950 [Acidimicrobiales bacterium]|nr:hypothetical protein [Acidimicrobiales bacterium]
MPKPIAARAAGGTARRVAAGLAVVGCVGALVAPAPAAGAATLPASNPPSTTSAPGSPAGPGAYTLLGSAGSLLGFGGALHGTMPAPTSPVVGVASTPDGRGAVVAEANGTVVTLGDAVDHGSMAGTHLSRPLVGVAVDPATGGYWLVAADGGIFAFDAPFLGSTGGLRLAEPIVGMSATPSGRGYRMVASDGGIFAFGDAGFYGSTGAIRLAEPVVGMSDTPDGRGYWMVASDGGVFSYGDATFLGSTGATHLAAPVIAMAATADGRGYWMVASDGGIFAFGDAPFLGSAAGTGTRVVGMAAGVATGYANPLRAVTGLRAERVDEGVDYGGSGPVYALGDGVVTSTTGNWPAGTYISYRLTDGPAAGESVYVAENVTPTVTVGQTVTMGTVVGILHDAYPDMEIGWSADAYGDTMAAAAGQWTPASDAASQPTAFGVNFDQLLVGLGAPSGTMGAGATVGSLPAGWPTW